MNVVDALPKAELHVHLEGTLEPEQAFRFARRNDVALPWPSPAELRADYEFSGLEDFLRVYWAGCRVLHGRQDFYDLTTAYLRRAAHQGVRRTEMFFSPENFLDRGIAIDVQLGGVFDAIDDARSETGIDAALLVIAQRHRDESSGLELLDTVEPYREAILGVGLGSAESGNPPSKFARFFSTARSRGYRLTCHAGEEGPAGYVRDALDLGVERIDHGVAALSDPGLVRRLADEQIPVTLCPLSNLRLRVTEDLATYPLRELLAADVVATVNSDDPPYFGGYVNENLQALTAALGLTTDDLATLARNSFRGSFDEGSAISRHLESVDAHLRHAGA